METLENSKQESWLQWFLRGILILGFLILFARLFELTVIKGNHFRALAENNRIRRISITAPRGIIYARGGEILVGSDKDEPKRRSYPLGANAAHVTGYLSEVQKDEVSKTDPDCLLKGPRRLGSLTGRGGLEEYYDCPLRGVDGEELVEVDTLGNTIRTLGTKVPIAGSDIHTNIDIKLQKKVAETLEEPGAIVINDASGQVLALFSSPSFDPENVQDYLNDPGQPLYNRSISGRFHPGSVFKLVTAIAALEEKEIDKDYSYDDKGFIEVDEYRYNNWYFTQYGSTEGVIDLPKAIARSTDTFFYKIGEFVGAKKLANWSNKFGLSQKTNLDLPGEIEGLVPTPKWKRKIKREAWFLGNTYHMAIGQGDLAVTPAAISRMFVATVTNNLCELKIVGDPDCKSLNIKKENRQLIIQGMTDACMEGGTGVPFFSFDTDQDLETPDVACKTGTAQTNKEDVTHAWFIAHSPVKNPEIFITVLVEEGGEGSKVAAPIALEIFNYYFNP